jgi:hypothetical protein
MTAVKLQGAYLGDGEFTTRFNWPTGSFSTRDWESLDFGDKVSLSKVPGFGRFPVGRTGGQYDADDAKALMYLDKYLELQKALHDKALADGVSLTDVEFELDGWWFDKPTDRSIPVRLVGCRIIGRAAAIKAGEGKPTVMQIPLSVMYLYIDGVCLVEPIQEE